jgi:predicted ester cyclase
VFHGTHRGDFLGIAPTGRELTFEGITIDRVVDGKIVEIYFGWDPDSVVEQLGAVLHAEPAEETNHT